MIFVKDIVILLCMNRLIGVASQECHKTLMIRLGVNGRAVIGKNFLSIQ